MFRSPKDFSRKKQETKLKNIINGYFCDLCDQGPWSTEMDVDIHRKNIHKWYLLKALKDDNIQMCSVCLRKQKDKKTLINHIIVNHLYCPPNATMINRKIYICNYCNRLFFNKQLLITHIYHWHTKKTPDNAHVKYNCPKCWKIIRAKSTWFHLLYHDAFNLGTCPICLNTYETHTEMLEHLKIHPSYFCCNICNYETTKESYFKNHVEKHKKNVRCEQKDDVSRFFLPQLTLPSINNRMTHIFKGIPLADEVKICILCRALCVTEEEMRQHIYGAHAPDEKAKSKTHQCLCGEEFFNNVLLKHHIFKSEGNHGVWDGVTPILNTVHAEEMVYQVYGLSDPLEIGVNEIIIAGMSSHDSENYDGGIDQNVVRVFDKMETL